jgi:hypothetical protein
MFCVPLKCDFDEVINSELVVEGFVIVDTESMSP